MLNLPEARAMWAKFVERRERFPDEPEETSFLVLMLNYGDHLTDVWCTNGEWSGKKGDVPVSNGIPVCPNNHPLYESPSQYRLAMVLGQH